jgi:hypothetical protein
MTAPVLDISAAIDEAVSAALPVPQPEVEDAPPAPVSDSAEPSPDAEVSADMADAAAASSEDAADSSGDEPGAEAPSLPDGYVAVPTVAEGLATDFRLMDAEGEVEIPALIVEYKANGKVRQDRLDQVVKLAQWGVYNQDQAQRMQQETAAQIEQAQQLLMEREAQMERLLVDEAFREAVQEAYLAENSPEQRAARAEQRIEDLKIQHQLEQISTSGEQFYEQEVMPALQMIQQALPTLDEGELLARLEMAMKAHAEVAPNGVPYISPSRYDAIRQYIVEDLALWAQAAHVRRAQPAQAAQANAELERAQVEAQKAKRMVGQKLKPVGQPGVTPDRPAKPKPIHSVDDAVESALSSVLSSLR